MLRPEAGSASQFNGRQQGNCTGLPDRGGRAAVPPHQNLLFILDDLDRAALCSLPDTGLMVTVVYTFNNDCDIFEPEDIRAYILTQSA